MTGYIEPPIETDPDDLAATALDTLMASIPGWIPRDAHLEVWLIQVLARMVAEARDVASAVPLSIFRYFGKSLLGILPTEAAPATVGTTWTMVDSQGYTVPVGTVAAFRTAGDVLVPFVTTTPIVVSPGNVSTVAGSAILEAVEPGVTGNTLTGALELVDALAYVSAVTAPGISAGGVDAEADSDYLDRLSQELELLAPRPILPPDFAVLARRTAGVYRALAVGEYLPGVNEIQTVNVASATGGTFTLTFNGQTTGPIAYNATAAVVRTALEALSNIAPGDVTTLRGPLGTDLVSITFGGQYLYTNVAQITGTSSLTGAGATLTTATTTAGVAAQTNVERTVSVAVVDEAGNPGSAATKAAVAADLDAEREINFVVNMIDPTYTTVSVTAQIKPLPGYATAPLLVAVTEALENALDPGVWGGGDQSPPEWLSTANRVRLLEVGSIIDRVPGVDYVDTPSLLLNGAAADVILYGPAPLPLVGTINVTLVP